jgi:hypothetical protein
MKTPDHPTTLQRSGWEEWMVTLYEQNDPTSPEPHLVQFLCPYDASRSPIAEHVSTAMLLETINERFAHMRYLPRSVFEHEHEARMAAYRALSLEEVACMDARMCVYSSSGETLEVSEFLSLPPLLNKEPWWGHTPAQQDEERYWRAFLQEISVLETIMAACGPTILPDLEPDLLVVHQELTHLFETLRRFIRLQEWVCCDIALGEAIPDRPQGVLFFRRDLLKAEYFARLGASRAENLQVLKDQGVLIDSSLYYEEAMNKRVIRHALAQGGWEAARDRGDEAYPRLIPRQYLLHSDQGEEQAQ